MKGFKHLWKIVLVALVLCFGFSLQPVKATTSAGYDITHYDVVLDVGENGVYTVTETIDVTFSRNMHGIYLNLSSEYNDYTWDVNGKRTTMSYHFPISDVKVLSDQGYEIDYQGNGVSIRMGSADYYADTNERYQVTYKIHTTDLGLGGKQMLYWNLISNDWEANILSSSFTVNMPKDFDASKLYFYTEGHDVDPALQYTVEGNTIKGTLDTPFGYGRGITILCELPDEYFDFSVSQTGSNMITAVSAAVAALFVFLFYKFGKDNRVITTVEFKAPKDVTSAGVGYIIDGVVDNKDVSSLILDWANKGYIKITDQKKDLLLEKMQDLPTDSHPYEVQFFNAIFSNGKESRTTSSMASSMYESFMLTKTQVQYYYSHKPTNVFSSSSVGFQVLAAFCAGLPISIMTGYMIYQYSFQAGLSILVGVLTLAAVVVSTACGVSVVNHWGPGKIVSKIFGILGMILGMLIAFGILVLLSTRTTAVPLWAVIAMMAITLVIFICAIFMKKRSAYGVEVTGKVRGLRQFIETAEKDRLDMLAKEDPQIFYHILPYAYAFGLTSVWREHFKDMEIPEPTWYVGDRFDSYVFMNHMYYHMDRVSNPTPPVRVSSGGGGSFGGGGFSGGGGGFSGGGFGGSHGGGW